MNLKNVKSIYESPKIDFWVIESIQSIFKSESTDLYLEGDIDGYESIGEF